LSGIQGFELAIAFLQKCGYADDKCNVSNALSSRKRMHCIAFEFKSGNIHLPISIKVLSSQLRLGPRIVVLSPAWYRFSAQLLLVFAFRAGNWLAQNHSPSSALRREHPIYGSPQGISE
jgi:hypothetical protein